METKFDVRIDNEGKLKGKIEKNPKNIMKNIAVDAVVGKAT